MRMVKFRLSEKSTEFEKKYSWFVHLKFIYSEKATKFCEIFTLLLTTEQTVKSKVKVSRNFVSFSEYMNFSNSELPKHEEDCANFCAFQKV